MNIVQERGSEKFLVPSESGKDVYHVDIVQPFCECRDFIISAVREGRVCKHIKKVRELLGMPSERGSATAEDNSSSADGESRE
ncbi:hypothetical protein D6783_03025 [Candidatus Woesearchaeota archaeon]|nr:MAG: hypothetical protein D6783_03025 [Candidatus Woesearchaeota archaeon]